MRQRWLATTCVAAVLLAALGGGGCTTAPRPPVETAAYAGMAARLDPIVRAPGATVSVRVIELPSRRELYANEPDRPMMPASNMKLVTTSTALDLFGPDYQFQTRLAVVGDDLYLIG